MLGVLDSVNAVYVKYRDWPPCRQLIVSTASKTPGHAHKQPNCQCVRLLRRMKMRLSRVWYIEVKSERGTIAFITLTLQKRSPFAATSKLSLISCQPPQLTHLHV